MSERIRLQNRNMTAVFDQGGAGICSLTSPYDGHKADFVLTPEEFPEYDVEDCQWLGNAGGMFTAGQNAYRFSTGRLKAGAGVAQRENGIRIAYPAITDDKGTQILSLVSDFQMEEEQLYWTLSFTNHSEEEVLFTDLNLPLLMNQYFRNNDDFKYDRCALRHTCITGHSSYLYWEKSSGNAPVLLLAPLGDDGLIDLRQEQDDELFRQRYGDGYGYEGLVRAYVASARSMIGPDISRRIRLQPGETREFPFVLTFLESEKQIDDRLASLALTVLRAVPGMVGPISDDFLVMTRPVEAVVSVCAAEDQVLESYEKNGWRISRIRFGGYGKRYVQVTNDGNVSHYCFFGTEDVGDMICRHAGFIAANHLETDETDPCYHGLLMWDMANRRRINSTFNPYHEDWWRGGSDDPGLASGLFLSEKNVYLPAEEEIRVLHVFVEDFLLKRLTEQPGWRVHRMVPWYTMFEPWAGRGADDVWRAFNYVHVINILYNMYRIRKAGGPEELRPASEYLEMAYEYTAAMFRYWMFPDGVGATQYGNMGEMTLPLMLEESLREEGMEREAEQLKKIFDTKAAFFASKTYPFGSEMVYDSTAFEAVYAYGKRIGSEHIMSSAAKAAYANRGKQPVWFLYNTDLRAGGDTGWNSSYMTQLGAVPILDHTLNCGYVKEEWILSYYGSYLSGWLLYNSGGYWDEDAANKGASGWITIASRINHTGQPFKGGMPLKKGCVALSGEAGIGYFGALRTACSIVLDHSVLGRLGLGCRIDRENDEERVKLRDGVSRRLYYVPGRWLLEAEGGYIKEVTIGQEGIRVRAAAWYESGMTVRMLTIPEEGGRQELIACQKTASGGGDGEVYFPGRYTHG